MSDKKELFLCMGLKGIVIKTDGLIPHNKGRLESGQVMMNYNSSQKL